MNNASLFIRFVRGKNTFSFSGRLVDKRTSTSAVSRHARYSARVRNSAAISATRESFCTGVPGGSREGNSSRRSAARPTRLGGPPIVPTPAVAGGTNARHNGTEVRLAVLSGRDSRGGRARGPPSVVTGTLGSISARSTVSDGCCHGDGDPYADWWVGGGRVVGAGADVWARKPPSSSSSSMRKSASSRNAASSTCGGCCSREFDVTTDGKRACSRGGETRVV